MPRLITIAAVVAVLCASAARGSAQPPAAPAASDVTVRAIHLVQPLSLDGRLDEAVYQAEVPVSRFLQQVPREGEPATERTEAWVMFDAQTLYVSARCWDSAPTS